MKRHHLRDALSDVADLQLIEITRFSLGEAAKAHAALESGKLSGRVVLVL